MADWDVTQAGQVARITTALGENGAFLEGFTAVEALGEPFRITCQVVCPQAYDFLKYRGTGVSLEVDGDALSGRAFHGVLTEASLIDSVDGGHRFELVLRPWFWVLSLGRNSRIFQKASARDIITKVFTDAGIVTSAYDLTRLTDRGVIVREYCVQFEESDFAFVSRLMEEEGIYYVFVHTANSHVMTLCDAPSAHTQFPGGDILVDDGLNAVSAAHLQTLSRHLRPTLAGYAVRDQHPRVFGDPRDAAANASDMPGAIQPKAYHYPGGFAYLTDDGATTGDDFALLRLQADAADAFVHVGYGDTFAVPTGCAITLKWNGDATKMLVRGATHRLTGQRIGGSNTSDPTEVSVEIECVDYALNWRPHLRTPKPSARGPQVAKVVGRAGEEIDVDDLGRVRIQFPWDRGAKGDETSSCWVRVAFSWAGPDMGELFLPRIGHEVVVDYIDGDLDRPLVTGRVYDSKNTTPAALPAGKTSSGWKTQTVYGKSTQDYDGAVEPPSDEPGFNMLVFEDKSGSEKVRLRAQRDLDMETFRDAQQYVHRDQTEKVGRNLGMEVETGDHTHKVTKGKRTTTINQDEALTVEQGDMATTVSAGDQSTTVSAGDQSTTISQGGQTTEVKMGDISVKAALGNITLEAMQAITFKVGTNKIVIDQMGVTVNGALITVEATGIHTIKGATVMIN